MDNTKVIFLDVDGVLNSDNSLMSDDALEEALILKLQSIVQRTGAKIILSSAWRMCFRPVRTLMEWLGRAGLYLSGMTPNGVRVDWLKEQGYTPTRRYIDTWDECDGKENEYTTDRGAEIRKWLSTHPEVTNFVVLDDEAFDILPYCPDNLVKTNFRTGLTREDVDKAIAILMKE